MSEMEVPNKEDEIEGKYEQKEAEIQKKIRENLIKS